MAAILNTAILNLAIFDSSILVCPLKLTHTCQDWFPPFAQKNFTHSFWLNLMMAAILNSAIIGFRHLVIFFQIPLKTTLTPLWLLKLIQSDSNKLHSLILTQMMTAILTQILAIFDSTILVFLSNSHTYQDKVPTICTKNFTHLFWLNLMIAAILNSAILNSRPSWIQPS